MQCNSQRTIAAAAVCKLSLLLLLLTFSAAAVGRRQLPPEKIGIDTNGDFVDGYGRVRLFHGINSVQKGPPWYSQGIVNATLLQLYRSWGFNVVRLGCMWAGAQPEGPGKFNHSYLSILAHIMDSLADHGIYTILDMHQDVISSKFDTYDGIPRWLVNSFPAAPQPYPWPLKHVTSWAEGYLTWAVGSAFQHLYSNTSSALTEWGSFWRQVAKLAASKPRLLGYELINEPWAGDVFKHPTLLAPGEAGRRNLLPVYDYLAERLAEVDPHSVVFYEPVTWSLVVGGPGQYGTGFDRVPASRKRHSALSFHYYCWIIANHQGTDPHWQRLLCDAGLLKRTLANAALAANRTGGALFLTEFGLCSPNSDLNSTNTVECNEVLRQADAGKLSWTYWDSNFLLANGSVNMPTVRSFARPYPMATAGQPIRIDFSLTTARFEFAFAFNASVLAPTEIFLPLAIHYPSGAAVTVTGGFKYRVDAASQRLFLTPTAAARNQQVVLLVITKK